MKILPYQIKYVYRSDKDYSQILELIYDEDERYIQLRDGENTPPMFISKKKIAWLIQVLIKIDDRINAETIPDKNDDV